MDIQKIENDIDLKNAQSEIYNLQEMISKYEREKFDNFLKSCKKMKFPENFNPSRFSNYTIGTQWMPRITSGRGGKIKSALPIVETWKTNKKCNTTHYVCYEKRSGSCIHVALKDDNLEGFEIIN